MKVTQGWGKVFFCPTPLGNLQDITIRTLEVLQRVDLIVCEDTRVTLKLLTHYGIKKPLMSYHSYNKERATRRILEFLRRGENVAFVSDAGMPGVQDPGLELIQVLRREGISFEVLPGPSAPLLGFVYAAFESPGFLFLGFLPRKKGERRKILAKSLNSPFVIVFYESPRRLLDTLREIGAVGGENRRIVVARELTKFYEEVKQGTVGELLLYYSSFEVRGEIVVVVEGRKEEDFPLPKELLYSLQEKGLSERDIVDVIHQVFAVPRGKVKKCFEKEKGVSYLEENLLEEMDSREEEE